MFAVGKRKVGSSSNISLPRCWEGKKKKRLWIYRAGKEVVADHVLRSQGKKKGESRASDEVIS